MKHANFETEQEYMARTAHVGGFRRRVNVWTLRLQGALPFYAPTVWNVEGGRQRRGLTLVGEGTATHWSDAVQADSALVLWHYAPYGQTNVMVTPAHWQAFKEMSR